MTDKQNINWSADGQLQVLTFDMHGETFAIEASLVREILDHTPETAVPGAASLVGGVINFRGRVIPLADLHMSFGFPPAEGSIDSRVVVIEMEIDGEAVPVGLKADKVNEVTILELASAEAAPRVGMRWRQDFIRCLAKRDSDFIVVPDLERIFSVGCRVEKTTSPSVFTQH